MPDGALVGDFVHKADVKKFLDIMCASNDKSNYPFSTQEYREFFRHSLWILPGVKEARALSALLKEHSVFGSGAFNIVNVAGNGDEEIDSRDALDAVRKAFGDNPDETYSITLSCGRLTTGVTVSEWTAVFMLAGTFSTSASSYMQTIFRVQSPANINGKVKERCCVFDFAPDRTLKMVAEAGRLSTKTGKTDNDRKIMGEFLNFCPVISVDGSSMQPYNVDRLLQQLKKAYTDRVVRNGFDDRHIYNDNLLKLDDIELADFEALKKIVGASKQTEKVREIDINDQGFTDEEYAELERIEKKPKKERTPEDLALLEEKKKKRDNAQKAMSILRGVSIRIPLLIYGAEVPVDKEITVNNFVDLIDDSSWNEFMPTGVTKATYKKFSKYYEQDVFVAAGRQIRNMALAADELSPDERVKKIAAQFAMFKNPDKETVLTPWRVVNMHMSDCLGGYCFYNEDFTDTLEEPRFVDRGKVTADTLANTKAQILEINSKTGLYPLYVTYSIYRKRCEAVDPKELTIEKQYQLWRQTVEENVFVICKTPMAKAITKRTLLGYRKGKINAHAFDDLIMQLKEKPEQFREKILRGSFWNKENKEMKFDAVVGNPPYQETISNNDSNRSLSKQLFPEFIKLTIKLNPKYSSLITPSRWFTGEAQDGSFISLRKFVKEHNHFVSIYNYSIASNVFNNVWIAGGVNYYLYDRDYSGKVDFYTCNNVKKEKQTRDLFEEGLDIVINSGENYAILQKVRKGDFVSLTTITKGRDAFGITGKNAKNVSEAIFFDGAYELRCAHEEIRYVKKDIITKNMDIANKWKVFISKGNGGAGTLGDEKQVAILGKPYLGKAKSVCTDSLIPIGCFDTEAEALNLQKYIKTKFLRYIVGILKVSQNVYQNVYQFVPLQDFTEKSDIDWSKSVTEIDQQLYKKYNLSDEEITFIESMIKPME